MALDDHLRAASEDGRSLLAAARTDWARPVPHCPAWDTAGLVRHTGGIFAWMAAIVTSGDAVNRRSLPPPPDDVAELPAWYLAQLEQVVAVLASADAASETWTFSSTGDRRVGWWRRRLAVEVAIHRWDAQDAVAQPGGPPPAPLDGDVAAAGIEEFLGEFLRGLLSNETIARPGGILYLGATDAANEWWIDLDAGGAPASPGAGADAEIRGPRSGLLLWLTNRGPVDGVVVAGHGEVAERWDSLRR